MDVDFMRFVDYWVGVPVCFMLSLFDKLNFFKRNKRIAPRKILFIQMSEMGSAVYSYSAIKRARELYPGAEIHYLIFKEWREMIEILGAVPKENILTIRGKGFFSFFVDTLKMILKMRSERFDAVLDLELFSRYSMILSYLGGGRERVGFHKFHMEGLYRGDLLTRRVYYNALNHISLNFLSLVEAISSKDVPAVKKSYNNYFVDKCMICSSDEQKNSILRKLSLINPEILGAERIVVVNANASQLLPIRKWPAENYVGLIRKLLDDKGIFVVLSGVESEKEDGLKICEAVNNKRCINFIGKTNLRELFDLFNVSDVLVSNDSGPPHFASMTNIKVIVLFGPESPALYAPLGKNIHVLYSNFACSPCVSAYTHRKSACRNNKCLKAITPDMVFNEVLSCLREGEGRQE